MRIKAVNSIKEINLLKPEPHYLDASVCVSYFNYLAERAFTMYNTLKGYPEPKVREYWFTEYCKWTKYAKIFQK